MIWSISESKAFRRCQRQWYFKHCVANANATKNPLRRRAYVLSKLQSISGWRGTLVDTVISTVLIPALNRKQTTTLQQLKARARVLFDAQLQCAREHRLHEPDFSLKDTGENFAAFHCMEYDREIPDAEIVRAWDEVDRALSSLFNLDQVRTALKTAKYLVAQRALTVAHSGVTVRAVPDVIAFYDASPPAIIDWKVHVFGLHEAWLQLGTYALALAEGKPHKDFPVMGQWKPDDIRLMEVQLLNGVVREHRVEVDRLADIHDYIAHSVNEILLVTEGRDNADMRPEDFGVTRDPDHCRRCPFRSICWEDVSARTRNERFPGHEPERLECGVPPVSTPGSQDGSDGILPESASVGAQGQLWPSDSGHDH